MTGLNLASKAVRTMPFGIKAAHRIRFAADEARDRGDWAGAAEHYRRYLVKRPRNFAIWVQLGHALKEDGRHIEALDAYRRALSINDRDADLLLNLGHLRKVMGHDDLAEDFYRRSAEVDGNHHALAELNALGVCDAPVAKAKPPARPSLTPSGSKGWGRIRARLRALVSLKTRANQALAGADQARARGDWSAAADLYRAYLVVRPDDFAIWVQLGHALKESGQYAESLAAYNRAFLINNQDTDLLLNLGHLQKRMGHIQLALKYYRESAENDGNLDALNELRALESLGRDAASLAKLEPPGLFEGSNFDQLAFHGAHQISEIIKYSATPPELLARVSKSLYSPTISIIIPVYNTPARFFREVIQSVFAQTYMNWEMCLVDDGSSSPSTIAIFDELTESPDPRVKTLRLDVNRGIAGASHAALELAEGEYVGFLDHDDLLTSNALSEVVSLLRAEKTADFIYTDHVIVDRDGNPKHYSRKPDWSPEFLLSTNYVVHFKVARRELLLSIGGLKNEIDNVQDLGMTCALVAAGATVRHLPKPVYLWREHRASVALSTQAKPGIEQLLVKVYDRHLAALGVPAKQSWPDVFRVSRTGVFQLAFTSPPPRVALILLSRGSDEEELEVRERFGPLLEPHVNLYIVNLCPDVRNSIGIPIRNDQAMLEFLRSIDEKIVAFANTTAQYIGVDWITRLAHYANMDPSVGAAGGKVLDLFLQIRSGGMLLDADGNYRTIGGGSFDNANGHWFNGQVASNVDAISSQIFATQRNILIEMGGVGFHFFGDAAPVAYSAALRLKGYRIVYDPFSRVCDISRLAAPESGWNRLGTLSRDAAPLRIYQALGV